MQVLHSVLFGIFVLVLVYLVVMNSSGVVGTSNALGSQSNNIIRTLQGR